MYCLFEYTKNTWTIYFVYVLKASPNANHLKRANAHAEWREQSTSVLDDSIILAIFENKNQKWTFCLMSLCCCYVTIRSYTLKGETLISLAKIVIISEIRNDIT